MENTHTVKFDNDNPEWFISVDGGYQGPLKPTEIYQRLMDKTLSWIDYIYRESDGDWTRIADHPVFKALQPEPPKPKPKAPPPIPKVEDQIKWFLFQNDNQTGPYATDEIKRLIASGQVLEYAYVWQEKFTEWKSVQDVPELKHKAQGAPPPPASATKKLSALKPEKRHAPRKPLMAQVYVTNQSDLSVGICRDISVGGMQLLTDQIPGDVGDKIHLNVTPPKDTGLKPFVAEGTIVRILEDGRGFAFRFNNLSAEAKKAIESYIA